MSEVFNKLSKRERTLMIIALAVILIYSVYAFVLGPSKVKLEKNQQELFRLEQQEAQFNREVANFNQLKETYENYSFEELLIQLPEQGKVPEVIRWLEDLFKDPLLTNPSIGFSMGEDIEPYLQVTLSFSGPFANVHGLINKIEANERVTAIDRTNLSRGQLNTLTSNLTIRIYGQDFTDISEGDYNFNKIDLFRVD